MEVKSLVKHILSTHLTNDKAIYLVDKIAKCLIQKLLPFLKKEPLLIATHWLDRINQLLQIIYNRIYRIQNQFNPSQRNKEIAIRLLDRIHESHAKRRYHRKNFQFNQLLKGIYLHANFLGWKNISFS